MKTARADKMVLVQFDPQGVRQFHGRFAHFEARRQHHHVEGIRVNRAAVVRIAQHEVV